MSNYQITMMSGDKYLITEEEFKKLATITEKGLIFIPSINGLINLSSVETVISEDKIDIENVKEIKLLDGTIAIRKFGFWVNSLNGARIDTSHYPELTRKSEVKKLN